MDPVTRPQGREGGTLGRLDDALRRLARAMLLVAGWGLLLLGMLVAVDVAARNTVGRNIGGVDEIAGYIFAIGISWSLTEAFYARSHVRIDFLYQKAPPGLRALLDVSSILALGFAAAFLAFSGWLVVSGSWGMSSRSASVLQVPLVIPQLLWFAGMLVFLAALLVSSLQACLALAAGRHPELAARFGIMSASEEAQEALGAREEKA